MSASRSPGACPAASAASSFIPVTRPTCCGWPRWCRRRSPRRRPSSAPSACCGGRASRRVRVAREVEGFVFNRLQGAVLREAYCLVRDGVATVADIDRLMRDGLGLRWAAIGPFETVDLNTRGGIAAHAERMGPAYARMGAERGQDDPWTPELVAEVAEQRRAAPAARRLGRARRLARPDADGAAAGAAGGGAVITLRRPSDRGRAGPDRGGRPGRGRHHAPFAHAAGRATRPVLRHGRLPGLPGHDRRMCEPARLHGQDRPARTRCAARWLSPTLGRRRRGRHLSRRRRSGRDPRGRAAAPAG